MATTSDLAKAWRGFMGHADALVSSLDSGSGAEVGLRDLYCAAAGALTAAARDLGYNEWHEGLLPGFRQPPPESLAPKLRWLQALTQAGAPPWILSQLRALPRLLDSLRQPNPRNRFRTPQAACRTLNACNFTCEAACTALILAIKPLHSLDPVRHWVHVSKYGAPFADAAFLSALSRAARAAAEAAGGPEPPAPGGLHPPALQTWVELCAVLSKTAAYCLNLAAIILEAHLAPLRRPPDGSTAGSASEAVRLPAVVPRLAQALRDSELAAGLARACFASVGPRPELPPGWAGTTASASGHALGPCRGSGGAAAAATAGSRRPGRPWSVEAWLYAGAVGLLTTALLAMHARQEPALVQVRTALADLLGHDDVAAMRLALLQSLWRQGGVGPGPSAASAGGGGGGGSGVLGGGGGDGDDGGGEGGSGDLALLWEHHERVLKATVGLWQVAAVGMAAVRNGGSLPLERGLPAGEQLARAAARTAEALQRIRRSWIPGGVSNSGQAWSLPVPVSESLSFLLPFDDTERRIQPGSAEQGYWAESAARLLPGTTEALELCLAEPESDATLPRLKTAASNAARVVGALARLARGLEGISGPPHGSWSLSDDADLGAELDHALRLAFLATERVDVGRDRVDVGRGLEALQGPGGDLVRNALGVIVGQVPQAVAELGLKLVEEAEAGAGAAAGGAGGAGAGGAAALGEGGGALLSCAKRAAGLAWRLEAAGTWAHAVCLGPTSLAPAAVLNTLCMFLWYREQRCRMRGPGEQGRGDLRAAAPPADPRAAAATAGGGPAALAAAAAGPQAAAVADAAGGGGGTLEGELDAYVMQAAGSLAMQAAAATSLLVPTADTARSAELNLVRQAASNVVCFALRYAVGLCGTPAAPRATGSLPLARLLACQPHRLFSAGCKLLCAWAPAARPPATASPDRYAQWWTLLADVMPEALACLAAHPQLSGRVRRWLLVPTQPGRGVAGDAEAASAEGGSAAAAAAGAAAVCREERREGSGGAAACAGEEGCLGRVWAAAMRCRGAQDARHAWARSVCGSALQTAAQPGGGAGGGSGADGSAGGAGGGSGAGGSAGSAGGGNGGSEGPDPSEVDAAFRSVAQSLVDWMGRMGRSETLGSAVGPQPFREEFRRRAAAVLGTGTGMPEAERLAAAETQVEALMSPLPPPLAAPPEGRVLSRLRVCGNPGCCEFGGRSEGGLPLKQCGGCRAVRYCGGVCQRAHWRAGHKGECGDMAAAMAAAGERE